MFLIFRIIYVARYTSKAYLIHKDRTSGLCCMNPSMGNQDMVNAGASVYQLIIVPTSILIPSAPEDIRLCRKAKLNNRIERYN
jgi:hypothetical protein